MTEERMKLVEPILNTFENEDIKEFAIVLLDNLPEYIWHVGASSTGKYHPSYCLGELGLMRHQIAVVRFLNFFFELEQYNKIIPSRERDLLRVAALVHDGRKSGSQSDYERNKYTKFDHPLQMATAIRSYDGKYLNHEEIELIAHCIESHMGQFNVDRKTGECLPKPEDMHQELVHLADYLASRKSLTMDFENIEVPLTVTINPEKYVMQFGKYKGQKIIDVYREHPDYLQWCEENIGRRDVLDAIAACKKKAEEKIEADDDIDL